MFDSIKNLVNVPCTLRPYVGQSGTGAKTYATSIPLLCYPLGDIVVIKTPLGKEVTSATQLYLDGTVVISELDKIIFEGRECPIEKINTFYNDGMPDIKVVYL